MIDEKISAFMDGECTREEALEVLKLAAGDPALRARLDRYYRLKAGMREAHADLGPGFAEGVMARIAAEDANRGAKVLKWRERPVLRAVSGLALAASVAAIAVITLQTLPSPTSPAASVATSGQTSGSEVAAARADETLSWDQLPDEAEDQLNQYLISHNNNALDHGFGSSMGFMRVAAHDGGTE